MTISSESIKAGPFEGNGSTTSFPFTFKTFNSSDLTVIKTDSSGVESTLVLDSDYSVSLNADQDSNPGGSVTYPVSGSPLAASNYLTIRNEPSYTQSSDLVNGGAYNADTIENALDRNTILATRLKELVERSARLSAGDVSGADVTLPAPSANQLLGWNNAADALENKAITDASTYVISAYVATLLNAADADAFGALMNDELKAIAALTSAADKLPYFTGSGTASLADITAVARTFLAASTAEAAVDAIGASPGKNYIMNGAFDIWQRGTSNAGVSASEYLADRWKWLQAPGSAARITHNRSTDVPSGLTGHSLAAYVTTADSAIAAGDYYGFKHVIEGYDAKELLLGTSGAKTVTLSFWVYAITAGTYCVGFRNAALNRSYVAEYTVNSPDTWEFKTITLTLDTSGTWANDNTTGIDILFCIASGSTFQTTAGAWTAGNYFATANQVNGVPTTTKAFRLKNVKLEEGSVYSGFSTAGRNLADELQMCKRYCQRFNGMGTFQGYASSANNVRIGLTYPVEMRTAPTLSLLTSTPNFLVGTGSPAGSGSTISASVLTTDGFRAVIDGFTGLTTLDPAQSNENSDMIELDADF